MRTWNDVWNLHSEFHAVNYVWFRAGSKFVAVMYVNGLHNKYFGI